MVRSECVSALLSRANPYDFRDGANEDLAVSDAVGSRGPGYHIYAVDDLMVVDHRNDADLWQQVDHVLLASPLLLDALLNAVPFDFAHRESVVPKVDQGPLHGLKTLRTDDSFDLLHHASLPTGRGAGWEAAAAAEPAGPDP